ncbi:MAG: hypothetical protein ABJH05_07310 [Fulvivirga sp.]
MRILITSVLLCFTLSSMAQKAHVYYPSGDLYQGNSHILEQINKEFDTHERVYHFTPFAGRGDDLTTVGFLLFTDSALWIQTSRKAVIDSAVAAFDLDKFYQSNEFRIELDAFIAKGVLDRRFVESTLGSPVKQRVIKTKDDEFDRWFYPHLGIDLILEKDVVTHYIPVETKN